MTVPNALKALKPGTLVITPGDRNDVLLAAAMTAMSGTALAGVLLTGGLEPDAGILSLCKKAFDAGLPLLSVEDGSYGAATRVSTLSPEIPSDDRERVERTMNFVADRIDPEWLRSFSGSSREPRLSPPAFRHKLIEAARADVKRIVLPEGAEPRTVVAASVIGSRGIARCALLGNPEEIRDVAARQGVALPPSIEIIDAAKEAGRYVAPLVERRKAKGMTPELALQELSDPIMVGTMMMALGEADGLVSGAVHTTAHTIRPALQILKTAPGCDLVSSVFFMCLPEQVLVFGDCAVNPNPTAEQLADIAIQSADSALAFGIPARVAMLSYSTGTSGAGQDVDKVKKATEIAQGLRPDLAHRRAVAVRRRRDAGRGPPEGAPLQGGRPGHRLRLPGPEHGQRHLQGGAALCRGGEHGPHAAGAGQAGERPLPRLPGGGHRLHHHPHRHPGAAGGGAGQDHEGGLTLPPGNRTRPLTRPWARPAASGSGTRRASSPGPS